MFWLIVLIIVVLVLLLMWVVNSQRALVHSEEKCCNALSQIGVQQTSRWDALGALVDLMKGYSDQEYKTLMDVIALRQPVTSKSTAAEVENQENMITNAMTHIMSVTESYPELKSNEVYLKTMDNVNAYEDDVRMSRMVYNDSVTSYNRSVRQIPSCFIAGAMGFNTRDYLQVDENKTAMPNMK
ncbi:MAG: LemA family protein [Oscillospiraceae bacterium]